MSSTQHDLTYTELRDRWRAAGLLPRRTITQDIQRCAAEHGDAQSVFFTAAGLDVMTLGELTRRAEGVAAGLQALGVQPGDIVAVQVPNSLVGAMAQEAVWLCGAVLLPIVPIYGARELSFILGQSEARVLVVADRNGSRSVRDVLPTLLAIPTLQHVVVTGEDHPDGTLDFAALEATSGYVTPPVADPGDLALLVYTSGTTADPKGVQHSHESLLGEIDSLAPEEEEQAVHLAAFPAGHVAGALGLLRMLVLGLPTVTMGLWNADEAARLIEQFKVTWSVGAPVHLASIMDAAERTGADISTLGSFMVGAAAVPAHLVERADRVGIIAYRCYGSSEHPTISTGTVDDPPVKRLGTDGRLIRGTEVRIVDDEGVDVPLGADGEIVARGPEQFLGYLDSSLDAAAFLPERWLHTGDIGRLDAEGYLTITDRKKDIIVRGGENISSKEVEDVLGTHPSVLDVAAVAVPDPRLGERVGVFVILRPGCTLTLPDVDAHFRAAGLARQKTPERLEFVDDLPRTAAGKVKKFELRQQL